MSTSASTSLETTEVLVLENSRYQGGGQSTELGKKGGTLVSGWSSHSYKERFYLRFGSPVDRVEDRLFKGLRQVMIPTFRHAMSSIYESHHALRVAQDTSPNTTTVVSLSPT